MKILCIGDPHIEDNEIALADLAILEKQVIEIVQREQINLLVVMGDLFHNHATISLAVLNAWRKTSEKWLDAVWNAGGKIVILAGNHDTFHNFSPRVDQLPDDIPFTAVSYLRTNAGTISRNINVADTARVEFTDYDTKLNISFVPFCRNNQDFLDNVNHQAEKWGSKLIFCHQEFDGSKFENGFYSSEGVNPELLPKDVLFVSGHIHMPQTLGNIHFTGASRWRTASDANQSRSHLLIDTDGTNFKFTTIESECSKIIELNCTENTLQDTLKTLAEIDPKHRVNVIMVGNSAFMSASVGVISEALKRFKRGTYRTEVLKTKTKEYVVSEKIGVIKSLISFIAAKQYDTSVVKEVEKRVNDYR